MHRQPEVSAHSPGAGAGLCSGGVIPRASPADTTFRLGTRAGKGPAAAHAFQGLCCQPLGDAERDLEVKGNTSF